jgi:hypothetical protein
MVFETLIGSGEDGSYWSPTQKGQSIEGNIVEFLEDDYGKYRILLEKEDEDQITLPGHADLQQYIAMLEEGDYIRVVLVDIKKSNNPDYNDKPIYKVQVDKERKVEIEEVVE